MSERCPTCGAECTIEGKTTLHYQPETDRLRALLREALEDQYAQHAPGCNGAWGEEAICKCGYHDWRRRAEEAIR